METITHRICNHCKTEKPVSDLVPSKKYKGGYMPLCKGCRNDYWKNLRATNPDHNRRQIDRVVRSRMFSSYSMRQADYDKMVEDHGDSCALCHTKDGGRGNRFRTWNIDHCHDTLRVRGLLCHDCNIKLGHYEWFMENIGREKMEAYLANQKYSQFKCARKKRPRNSNATQP